MKRVSTVSIPGIQFEKFKVVTKKKNKKQFSMGN